MFKLQNIKNKTEHHPRILHPLQGKDLASIGCMQDSCFMLGGIINLLSLLGDLVWFKETYIGTRL